MTPLSIRNATWRDVQAHVVADRKRVYLGLALNGPCTTKALSERIGMSLLSVRPRVTELLDLYLVECTGRTRDGGVYRAVSEALARECFEAAKREALGTEAHQLNLFAA